MPCVRLLWLVCALLAVPAAWAADPQLARFGVVTVAPVTTSIYVGRVDLAASPFLRSEGSFFAQYAAAVRPFFFYSEKGNLRIDLADEGLRRLVSGQTVDFTGRAIRSDGLERVLEGRVTATGAGTGKIKVRLHVKRRVVLVFDTTYQLLPAVKPSGTQ